MPNAAQRIAPTPRPEELCDAVDRSGAKCTRGRGHGGSTHEHVTYTTMGDRMVIAASDFFPR